MVELNVHRSGTARAGRADRIAPLVGLAGQTSGETVALALARKGRGPEPTDEAELYARQLGRARPVALRAARLLWSALVGTAMPDRCTAALERELTGYDDDVKVMSPGLTEQTVRGTLGRTPAQAYAEFAAEPFGVGALGQVHSALLRDGRRVAVKIRYRGLNQAVRGVLAAPELHRALEPLVRAAAGERAAAQIHTTAGELRGRVEQLVGLKSEAALHARLAADCRSHPLIRVPGVIEELSTERMLTMDLAAGRGWAQAVRAAATERYLWGQTLFRFADSARIALDPGPGNYLFHDEGQVTILGFGTAGHRPDPEQTEALARRDRAVAQHDVDALRALHAEQCGYDDPGADPERLWAWHRRIRGPLAGPGPAACTPEWAADAAEAALPANWPCAAAHRAPKARRECLFADGTGTGLAAVLAALRATADWDATRAEQDRGGASATPEARIRLAGGTDGDA
ncbi:AarF/UbiB family protein [Streptomyces sp. NBC_01506]|uniref:AarF/UbiB family protein n=1 Tax=Streptomyces sp. NBC_01506 TaxID=2903887 RepID=UPI00386937CD